MVKLGYCGDRCVICPRYIASQSNDDSELHKVAMLWKKIGFRDEIEDIELLRCRGCDSIKICANDEIRRYCLKKKIENCGKCQNYPCILVKRMFEKTKKIELKCRSIMFDEFNNLKLAFFQKKENLGNEKKI